MKRLMIGSVIAWVALALPLGMQSHANDAHHPGKSAKTKKSPAVKAKQTKKPPTKANQTSAPRPATDVLATRDAD